MMARDNSRRYWSQNQLDVSDVEGAQPATFQKNKGHLKGSDNNLNIEDIVPKRRNFGSFDRSVSVNSSEQDRKVKSSKSRLLNETIKPHSVKRKQFVMENPYTAPSPNNDALPIEFSSY